MKTRSKGGAESGLKRKIARVPSNRDHEHLKHPVIDLTKTPVGKEIKLRTPKSREKRRAATPRRDDLICSQHFDSQVVVGWDCNSPDSIRDLRKLTSDDDDAADLISRLINDEPDDAAVPKRNTPPLLGMWRDTDKNEDHQVEKNTLLPNRFKKRGRSRRKSAKDSVSQALLQKLEKALDKCSDTDKVTEVRSTEAELFLSDCDEEREEEINGSDDLFEGVNITTEGAGSKEKDSKTKPSTQQNLEADPDWSDDELFEESFIVKPTQLSAETKKSQVFGLKRKPFRDSDLPQSKCSRVSVRQDNVRQPHLPPQPASAVTKGAGRFTAITTKQPPVSCDSRLTMNSSTGVNSYRGTGKPVASSTANTYAKNFTSTIGAKGVATHSVGVKPQNSLPNVSSRVRTDLVNNRNTTTQSRPMPSTSSVYSSNSSGLSPYIGQTTQNRPSAFKKHSSFSGTDSVNQSYASNRKRSISGNSNVLRLTKQETTILEEESRNQSPRNGSNMNRVRPGQGDLRAQTSLPSKPALNTKPQTVTSTASSSFIPIKNVTTSSDNQGRGRGLSSSSFDTSLSDDLLCQLAEPDDILDSQIDPPKPLKTTAVIPNSGVKTSNTRVAGVGNGNKFVHTGGVKPNTSVVKPNTGAVKPNTSVSNTGVVKPNTFVSSTGVVKPCAGVEKPAKQSDSKTAQVTVCKSVPSQNNQTKQYRFRDSQKSAASTSGVSSVSISNSSKVKTIATVSKVGNTSKPIDAPGPTIKKQDEKVLDEFDDSFDDDFSDDDGLTEPQILAMLDEAELLATQQCANSSPGKLEQKTNNPLTNNHGCISNSQGQTTNSQSQLTSSQGHVTSSQGQVTNSQGHVTSSPGHVTNSQGHASSSQGQVTSSPGHLASSQDQNCSQTASQAKYSAVEIERKKREAIEKRKLKSQVPRK